MSYQIGEDCYETLDSGVDALAGRVSGSVASDAGQVWVLTAKRVAGSQLQVTGIGVGGGAVTWTQVVPVELGTCGKLDLVDSGAVAWLIALVWVVAWGVVVMRRGL
jgi:hypothetical protein